MTPGMPESIGKLKVIRLNEVSHNQGESVYETKIKFILFERTLKMTE